MTVSTASPPTSSTGDLVRWLSRGRSRSSTLIDGGRAVADGRGTPLCPGALVAGASEGSMLDGSEDGSGDAASVRSVADACDVGSAAGRVVGVEVGVDSPVVGSGSGSGSGFGRSRGSGAGSFGSQPGSTADPSCSSYVGW